MYACPFNLILPDEVVIVHINITTLNKHFVDLERFIKDKHIDILCVTETHTAGFIPGFTMFEAIGRRGCAVFVSDTFKANKDITVFKLQDHIETLG